MIAGAKEAAEPTVAADSQNPYLGLRPYDEWDAPWFHGREREAGELLRLVRREPLTVLFGKSGLGKTSLLQAGLFPLLRRSEYLPVLVRLDQGATSPELPAQVAALLREAADEASLEVEEPGAGATLWEHFHRLRVWSPRNRLITPVLVFDQFEEVFTLGRGDRRVAAFLEELADLVENQIPRVVRRLLEESGETLPFSYNQTRWRVVLSLREDFLPQLEDLRPALPSLARNRFRLRGLSGQAALEAVLGPAIGLIQPDVAAAVVQFVAAARVDAAAKAVGNAAPEVEPSLLDLVCHELNQRRIERQLPEITADLLAEQKQEILWDFYQRNVADLRPDVRVFIEERLLTASGYRSTVAVEDALRFPAVDREVLERLIGRRLLRIEERLGIPHVELVHDVLTEVVLQSRQRRRQREAQRRRFRKAVFVAGLFALLAVTFGGVALMSLRSRDEARAQRREVERRLAELYEEQGRQEPLPRRLAARSPLSRPSVQDWAGERVPADPSRPSHAAPGPPSHLAGRTPG